MNLLLLLSALLSALTGAAQSVRTTGLREAVCLSATVQRVAKPCAAVSPGRPALALPRVAALPDALLIAFRLVPIEPAFAGRRRE